MKVKICGIRSIEVALAASNAGADFLGFNFAPVSKRRVELAVARGAIRACRKLPAHPGMAGIFVNQPIHEVLEIARDLDLDYVQLSGDEDDDYCLSILGRTQRRLIKAVRLSRPSEASQVDQMGGMADAILADASAEGSYGGSGQPWRWQDAADLAARYPVLLAGGLTKDNVREAIAAARPWGVDVASGVETNGQTDPEKVRAFIREVRANEHSHSAN